MERAGLGYQASSMAGTGSGMNWDHDLGPKAAAGVEDQVPIHAIGIGE